VARHKQILAENKAQKWVKSVGKYKEKAEAV
jgi:hypothetical protein